MAVSIPHYTVDDLDRFPNDGNRYELLDGVLLVTPAPGLAHQVIANRLQHTLATAVADPGFAHVVGPGVVRVPPDTHLEPDILVFPAQYPLDAKWEDVRERWLAIEVLSRSSRIYDREFKRDAYLTLGVSEVWLVDLRAQCVETSRRGRRIRVARDLLRWRIPDTKRVVAIELHEIFAGLP